MSPVRSAMANDLVTNDIRDGMRDLLLERSVKTGRFTLASGRESDFFIDCKQSLLSAEGHALSSRLMLRTIADRYPEVQAVAGVVLGGCPLASGVSLLSMFTDFTHLPALYVRKERKDHGSAQLVEGAGSVPRARGSPCSRTS